MALNGRTALVTGGAGHIGGAAAEALVELGARVILVDRDATLSSSRVEALRAQPGADVRAVGCDLADSRATRALVDSVAAEMAGLDIVVHSAALLGSSALTGWAVPFEEQTSEAFEAALRLDVGAGFALAQAARPYLVASGHGAICFIASIYGSVGPDMRLYEGTSMANPAGYAAGKGGIIQLTRYLATVLGPGVRVNSISPGGLFRHQPSGFVERYEQRTPLRRMGTEEDVKGAVGYLVSDLSAYVTGHNLAVDGGWTAW
jgi:NAD(P)-dependent dehydrogenase (short-subunit alcohol dehydrogenase family)